ncbi:uncharacterized protein BJ212DRAFT_976116 [Suillus subaureus]|uniref:DUF6533 domain-containing protein n=1 Tax=Suillus subaureus TaxID=48587 RepID=A0A9P7EGL2_9AGAM|nr:uncharacterized protein BJ212DRAFT_976116 [Suillus subaureus]KAG1821043.1 hypothetical protein BJ212DRAFT_976116 [Suillus subaureus]
MGSKYSVDAVTAARSLQIFTSIYASMATFWTYDYVCSISEEGIFLLYSRWNRVKFLYIVTRYVPFLLFVAHLYLNFVPDETSNTCQFVNNICSVFSLIPIVCSEYFFILRTCAIWNNNKIVWVATLSTFAAVIVGSMVALFSATATAPFETSSIPSITGCYQSSGSVRLFVPFLLLFGVELMLISLMLTRAIRNWRTTDSRLYVVILRHNVLYYACVFSTMNILASLLLDYAYSGMFQDFQIIIHAILATRMHLHLWHADRNRDCDVLDAISLSQLAPASHVESA